MMRKILLFTLLFLYLQNPGWAQVAGQQVPVSIPGYGTGSNALVYLPWDYNVSGKSYPLIIFGHGISETTVATLPNQGLPGIIAHNNPPYAIENSDTIHFIVLSPTDGSFLSEQSMSDGAKYLIRQGIRIDTNRVYVTGLSAGARSTVGYISHQSANNYQTVSAAVPMSYTLQVSEMDGGYWVGSFSAFKGKGVWAFTGASDVHTAVAQALVDSVNVYSPGNGRLTIYPGGHCCWMTYYDPTYRENINGKMMNIYEWMLQYHLNGVPPPPPANQPPVANAGGNQAITLPLDSVMLNGSASSDPDGKIVSYSWTEKSGPSGYSFKNADSANTAVTGLVAGTYLFTLTVTDNLGATGTANVSITVSPVVHPAGIVANAGNDTTIYYPINFLYLDGSRSYATGGILYSWRQVSGPSGANIKNVTRAVTKVEDLLPGRYVFRLTITDYSHNSDSAQVTITVLPDPTPPGDVSYTANTSVLPYNATFQYGTNPSAYNMGWGDTSIASISVQAGAHSLRLPLPDVFVGHYGYDIRLNEFNYYTQQLGMKEITLFVGQPRTEYDDTTIYPSAKSSSLVFANLYTPIWDNGENGTPVNDSNYFAVYIYNLVKLYGKNIRFWEIVNEADMTGFWDNANTLRPDNWWINPPDPGALFNLRAPVYYYIRMLRIAYEVIKKFYPDEYICTGGLGYPAFLDCLLRYTDNPDGGKVTPEYPLKGGAYFDVLSFHSYPAYNFQVWDNAIGGFRWYRYSDKGANAIIDLKNTFDSVLVSRGYNGTTYPKKPFILTETNVPRKTFANYFGSDTLQYNFIIKALIKSQQQGIKQFYIFQIGETEDYNTATDPNSLMGLYQNLNRDPYGQQKFTDEGKAFKTTSLLLYGWQYDSIRTAALNLPPEVDGAAFKKDTAYRYVLWAKTHTDMSEAANATYSFPAALNMDSMYRYEWNYSVDPTATSRSSTQNIALTGTPSFFAVSPVPDSVHLPPVANAGKNKNLLLPANSTTLDGSASYDPDGYIVRYKWTQQSGPSAALIQAPDSVKTGISSLVAGVYVFTLTVTDNTGAMDSASVTIGLYNAATEPPVADAGQNITVTLPLDSTLLDGSNSFDPVGQITGYHWEQLSGPSQANIEQADSAQCPVSGLKTGIYIFRLTVTNDRGITATSTVTVFVLSPEKNTSNTGFIIYPNPVDNQLHIEVNNAITGWVVLRIIDEMGRVVKLYQFSALPAHYTKVFDVSQLVSGLYFVQLVGENQVIGVKEMVKK